MHRESRGAAPPGFDFAERLSAFSAEPYVLFRRGRDELEAGAYLRRLDYAVTYSHDRPADFTYRKDDLVPILVATLDRRPFEIELRLVADRLALTRSHPNDPARNDPSTVWEKSSAVGFTYVFPNGSRLSLKVGFGLDPSDWRRGRFYDGGFFQLLAAL